jgi:hypothetical protein
MTRTFIVAAVLGLSLCGCARQPAPLKMAAKYLQVGQVGTMEVCATGRGYDSTDGAIAAVYDISNFVVSADYTEATGRVQITRRQRFEPGTLHAFPSEESADRFVADGYAWDVHAADAHSGSVPATQVRDAEVQARTAELWLYPQGFVRAAMKHKATAKAGDNGTDVSFTADDIKYVGTINEDGDVTRVHAWTTDSGAPVHFEAIYSDYRDYHGIRFPKHIVRNRNGQRELDLTVCSLRAGSAFEIFVPKAVEATARVERTRKVSTG